MVQHRFKNLKIWQEAIALTESVYKLTSGLPQSEQFGLVSQMNRCAVSIPSNIAEGSGRTEKEFSNFLRISLGSSFELETQLILTKNIGYIDEAEYEQIIKKIEELQKMLIGFQSKLKSNVSSSKIFSK